MSLSFPFPLQNLFWRFQLTPIVDAFNKNGLMFVQLKHKINKLN